MIPAIYGSSMSQAAPPAAETPLIEHLLPLIGVFLGALIGAGVSIWTAWQQRKAQVATEQRAREAALQDKRREMSMAASAKASEALAKLLLLRRDPDERRDAALLRAKSPEDYDRIDAELGPPDEAAVESWHQERHGPIVAVDTAILDITNREVRLRLEEAVRMLANYRGPEIHIRQSEYRTRHIAVADALGCLGAFRRDEPLPARTEDFVTTLEFVDLHLETLELNSGR